MELFEVFHRRRSIRKFKSKPVERNKINKLLEAAFLSPSSYNRRAWVFIVVDDHTILQHLSKSKLGAEPLSGASVAIVITVDEKKDDVWIEDGAIAAEHIQLAAVELGLASFWVQIRNRIHSGDTSAEEYVRDILKIPENYRVVCIIGIGYPLEKKSLYGSEIFEWEKVRYNGFSNKYKKVIV